MPFKMDSASWFFSTLASARSKLSRTFRNSRTTEAVTKRPKRSRSSVFLLRKLSKSACRRSNRLKAHRFPLAAWKSFDPWDQAYHLPVLRFFLSLRGLCCFRFVSTHFGGLLFWIFCLFVHRTSSLFFINFIHDHLQVVMKIIHHRNDLAVFHTGRSQHGKGSQRPGHSGGRSLGSCCSPGCWRTYFAANGDP